MNKICGSITIFIVLVSVCSMAMGAQHAVALGEKVKLEGVVVGRDSDLITVRTTHSTTLMVVLTDHTKFKGDTAASDVVPGLWIKFEGFGDSSGRVIATVVKFSGKDIRMAKIIQGGLTPLDIQMQAHGQQLHAQGQQLDKHQEMIQGNQQDIRVNQAHIQSLSHRFSELADYDVKQTALVYFASGSSALSADARNALVQLANSALGTRGYLIQVRGFADSTGGSPANQDLSMRRAQSVIAFLEQGANIPLTRILTPGAMGETRPVASNQTREGRAKNRRVEVTLLLNRGLAGMGVEAAK